MTSAQQMRRIYMILRWYDSHVAYSSPHTHEVTDDDFKLVMQLQKEYSDLQAEALKAKSKKTRKKKAYVRKKHTD
jgi:hypothetical protein